MSARLAATCSHNGGRASPDLEGRGHATLESASVSSASETLQFSGGLEGREPIGDGARARAKMNLQECQPC